MKKFELVFLFLFVLTANALATDYYVKTPANGGSDAYAGVSWETAKATITAAMALVDGSDNLHVAAGTYNERVSFPASNSNQLLGGYPAAGGGTRAPWTNQTIISGSGLTGSVISVPGNLTTNRGYVGIVIDGFTIRNGSKNSYYGAGIETYSVGLTITNCIIENNTSTGTGWVGGIYALSLLNEPTSSLLKIEASIIRNNSGVAAGAVLIDAIAPFQFQMVNTLIYGNSSTDTTTFLFGTGGVIIGTGSQMMPAPPNNPKIINCTIADNTAAHTTKKVGGLGINLGFGETVTIANSIIWHTGAGVDDIYVYNGETLSISYSDVRDPADPGESGPGVIHSDPSFVGVGNYRLNTGSPCIDTGSNSISGIPSIDLEGNLRIIDGDGNGTATVDMGAFEKAAPADTTPPTGSIAINGVAINTNTTAVTLTLSANDPGGVTHMCLSDTASCASWEAYTTTKAWILPSGDGTKTVNIWFRDGLGNENAAPFSDSITLDSTAPADGTLLASPGHQKVQLTWSGFSDALSGITGYKLVYSEVGIPASCSAGAEIYNGTGTSFLHTPLTNGTPYYYRVCALDGAGNTSAGAFASGTPFPDNDNDGVSDQVESGADGLNPDYDGNGDSTADRLQVNVTSLPTSVGSGYVTLASPNGTALSSVQAQGNPSPGDAPAGVTFPYGFFDFTVTGLTPGGNTTVTLYLPIGFTPNTYYKFGPTPGNSTPHWYEFLYDGQTGAQIAGNVVTLHFVDGQRGDDVLTTDGLVIDQGGPGVTETGSKLYLPLIKK